MNNTKFTLDDIRRHPDFPFDDWRESDVSFLMFELYWAEKVRAVLGEEIGNYTALFDKQRDGNPILDITNRTAKRGLRLIVIANEGNKPKYPEKTGADAFYGLYPFTNNSFLPDGETPVYELGMFLTLDERYTSYFEHLVRLHCCDYVSMEQMEEEITIYENRFSMRNPEADLSDD